MLVRKSIYLQLSLGEFKIEGNRLQVLKGTKNNEVKKYPVYIMVPSAHNAGIIHKRYRVHVPAQNGFLNLLISWVLFNDR